MLTVHVFPLCNLTGASIFVRALERNQQIVYSWIGVGTSGFGGVGISAKRLRVVGRFTSSHLGLALVIYSGIDHLIASFFEADSLTRIQRIKF